MQIKTIGQFLSSQGAFQSTLVIPHGNPDAHFAFQQIFIIISFNQRQQQLRERGAQAKYKRRLQL